jgi:hypothetical protein
VEKCRNSMDHWILQICEEAKTEHLLVFKSSEGVVVVEWESTGAVDLTR